MNIHRPYPRYTESKTLAFGAQQSVKKLSRQFWWTLNLKNPWNKGPSCNRTVCLITSVLILYIQMLTNRIHLTSFKYSPFRIHKTNICFIWDTVVRQRVSPLRATSCQGQWIFTDFLGCFWEVEFNMNACFSFCVLKSTWRGENCYSQWQNIYLDTFVLIYLVIFSVRRKVLLSSTFLKWQR